MNWPDDGKAEVVVKIPAWLIDEMLDASSECNNLPPLRLFILAASLGLLHLRTLFRAAKKEKLAREKGGAA